MAGFGSVVGVGEVSLESSPRPASPFSDIAKHVGPDTPVFVCLSRDPAASSHARLDGEAPGEGIPFNTLHPVPFESPLFKGRVVFNIAHLKPTPRCPPGTDPHKHVLNGCHGRAMECIIQGRFKRRVRFDELYTGQAFSVPLRRLPARWLIKATQAVVKSLAPATQLNIMGEKPFLMGPLASIASFLSVTSPGPVDDEQAPEDIFSVCEETALLGGPFADTPMDRNARKRYFSVQEHLANHYFETDLVYGFGFFGDRWRVSECKLDIGVAQIDMAQYLGQAPRVMARLRDTEEYAWAFDIWHERLLKKVDGAGEEEQPPSGEASPARSGGDSSPHTPSTPDTPGLFGSPGLWPWFRGDSTARGGGQTPRS